MKRIVSALGVIVIAIVALAALGIWLALRASLPRLDGEIELSGLRAPVVIERDALGVPTIRAGNREDLARATGFVHAQDRFFQMDLTRRSAAGELADLIGPAALAVDRANRIHGFRPIAGAVLRNAGEEERRLVRAYSQGVNQGLNALGADPFEYLLLRVRPQAWTEVDTVLTAFAMFLTLNDQKASRESSRSVLHAVLPEPLYEFLEPVGTVWDVPLVGGPLEPPAMPSPQDYDLRALSHVDFQAIADDEEVARPLSADVGSNSWAVAARLAAGGRAILANDMHLPLALPNTFYRARLRVEVAGDSAPRLDVSGVMIPGSFTIAAGSNGNVAWGFTNSYGDWADLVVLQLDPDDPERYLTPDGYRAFAQETELLDVKGGDPEVFSFATTIWGPVIDRDHLNRPRALRWLAHDPESINFGLQWLERARDVYEATAIASRTGIPPQNFVAADREGRVAWTVMGKIPARVGFDGTLARAWTDPGTGWRGWLRQEAYPRVIDPDFGRVWTANARVVDTEAMPLIGTRGYPLSARAHQIRDALDGLVESTIGDMLAIQLDDRAVMLRAWQTLLLEVLSPQNSKGFPLREEFRALVENWGGRASVESVGYRLVRDFRDGVMSTVYGALTAEVRAKYPKTPLIASFQFEGSLLRLVREQPLHLLNPRFENWNDLMLAVIDRLIEDVAGDDPAALRAHTWGRRNAVRIGHPLSRAVPLLSRWLDMPVEPLPGDAHMPRVQGVSFGASVRFAVSPGAEQEGYMHMPGGQSGHPMSPFYRAGHRAWAEGEPLPFLPGDPKHRLVLADR